MDKILSRNEGCIKFLSFGGIIVPAFDWSRMSLFFSAEDTQKYLHKCYQNQQVNQPELKSYENCYPFIYYLEHGKVYYEQASLSPFIIQPILIFYGLIHLMKACILTTDPHYPETTAVLAHGVSTRKRKKQQYRFFEDEVKIQKNGLFPHMSRHLFQMGHAEGKKITMKDLLRQIPELNDMFFRLEGTPTFSPVKLADNRLYFSADVLDSYHMTERRFAEFFFQKSAFQGHLQEADDSSFMFRLEEEVRNKYAPLKYDFKKKRFAMPLFNSGLLEFHELLIHYLLLYNLSMIARYETEWWSELVKTMPTKDFPFIETFLKITLEKGPFLVYQYLIGRWE